MMMMMKKMNDNNQRNNSMSTISQNNNSSSIIKDVIFTSSPSSSSTPALSSSNALPSPHPLHHENVVVVVDYDDGDSNSKDTNNEEGDGDDDDPGDYPDHDPNDNNKFNQQQLKNHDDVMTIPTSMMIMINGGNRNQFNCNNPSTTTTVVEDVGYVAFDDYDKNNINGNSINNETNNDNLFIMPTNESNLSVFNSNDTQKSVLSEQTTILPTSKSSSSSIITPPTPSSIINFNERTSSLMMMASAWSESELLGTMSLINENSGDLVSSLKHAKLETVDSSYDSDDDDGDQESSSQNSELRKFVNDLIDSSGGNEDDSTTPEDSQDPTDFSSQSLNNQQRPEQQPLQPQSSIKSTIEQPEINQIGIDQQSPHHYSQQQPQHQLQNEFTSISNAHNNPHATSNIQHQKQFTQPLLASPNRNQNQSRINNKKKRKSKKSQQQPQQQPQQWLDRQQPQQQQHDIIDRTISETLCQEYSEYITRQMFSTTINNNNDKLGCDGSSKIMSGGSSNMVDINSPEYEAKVKYAKKLGYNEQQVRQALEILGQDCQRNELLNELIQISSRQNVSIIKRGSGLKPSPSSASSSSSSSYHNHQPLGCSISSSVLLNCNNANNQSQKSVVGKTMSSPVIGGGKSNNSSNNSTCGNANQNLQNNLRSIVIDGSNVAVHHGKQQVFSCRGIELCINWFQSRGHTNISTFVPLWRKSPNTDNVDLPVKDREILIRLEQEGLLYFTPSRTVSGKIIAAYDDRYILRHALKHDAIIVSNDQFRDLASENPDFKRLVDERLLMYVFVDDEFEPPQDPLGPHGPSLEKFLSKPLSKENVRNISKFNQNCPYEKKCTYGNKCKYFHPERNNSTVNTSMSNVTGVQGNKKSNDSNQSSCLNSNTSSTLFNPHHASDSSLTLISQNTSNQNTKIRALKSLPLNPGPKSSINCSNSNLSIWPANNNGDNNQSSSMTMISQQKKQLFRTKSSVSIESDRHQQQIPMMLRTSFNSCNSPCSNTNDTNVGKSHRKLERQYTLFSDDDPRLSSSLYCSTNNLLMNQSKLNENIQKEKLQQAQSWNMNANPNISLKNSTSAQGLLSPALSNSMATLSFHCQSSSRFNAPNNNSLINNPFIAATVSPSRSYNNKTLLVKSLSTTTASSSSSSSLSMNQQNIPKGSAISSPSSSSSLYHNYQLPNGTNGGSLYLQPQPQRQNSWSNLLMAATGDSYSNNNPNHQSKLSQPLPPMIDTNNHNKKLNMYQHFSALFGKEPVLRIMQIMPDETDQYKICAAILELNHQQSSNGSTGTNMADS